MVWAYARMAKSWSESQAEVMDGSEAGQRPLADLTGTNPKSLCGRMSDPANMRGRLPGPACHSRGRTGKPCGPRGNLAHSDGARASWALGDWNLRAPLCGIRNLPRSNVRVVVQMTLREPLRSSRRMHLADR
jgi:hypothetical protein